MLTYYWLYADICWLIRILPSLAAFPLQCLGEHLCCYVVEGCLVTIRKHQTPPNISVDSGTQRIPGFPLCYFTSERRVVSATLSSCVCSSFSSAGPSSITQARLIPNLGQEAFGIPMPKGIAMQHSKAKKFASTLSSLKTTESPQTRNSP